ncbi:hypothetical protein SLS54_008884 [Diplodia seriata]
MSSEVDIYTPRLTRPCLPPLTPVFDDVAKMQITELPFELLEAIFDQLPTASILPVALTCHALNPAAIHCLYSTITIAPASAPDKRYSPNPYRLAVCLVNDRAAGARVRHLTFTNISPDATRALTPRRALPILVTYKNATP